MGYRESYQSIIEFINTSLDAEAPKVVAAFDLMKRCEEYAAVLKEYRNTKFQIEAFDYFLKGLTREQVLVTIQHRPWLHKHEILTKWAWMCIQDKHLNKGVIFNNPFSCEVGPRIGRQNMDREFEIFRMFIPLYRKHRNKKLLYFGKLEKDQPDVNGRKDPPDFIVKDEQGNEIGIEVTEVPLSKYINKQEEAQQRLFEQLHKDLYTKQCVLHFKTYPRWSYLYGVYDGLKAWLYPLFDSESRIESENQEIGVSIIIEECSDGFAITYSSDCKGIGYLGDRVEEWIAKSTLRMINQKANKKKKPSVTPCILVMYENTCLPMGDFNKVARHIKKTIDAKWKNKFSEVWLTSYSKCKLLLG